MGPHGRQPEPFTWAFLLPNSPALLEAPCPPSAAQTAPWLRPPQLFRTYLVLQPQETTPSFLTIPVPSRRPCSRLSSTCWCPPCPSRPIPNARVFAFLNLSSLMSPRPLSSSEASSCPVRDAHASLSLRESGPHRVWGNKNGQGIVSMLLELIVYRFE